MTALNGEIPLECMQLIKKLFVMVPCLVFWSCSAFFYEAGEIVIEKPCTVEDVTPTEPVLPEEPAIKERQWTILVYMCADNDLEAAAMEDLCEMEFSDLDTDEVSVLALVDRSPAYDTSYDNWYGSRLYKLKTGKEADSSSLISQEIECKDLGLEVGKETELDMSSSYVLSSSLSYARKRFPANHYGLIIWGHGTGWRSGDIEASELNSEGYQSGIFKGFSYDKTSGTYMTLYQTGQAMKAGLGGMKLDFLGFDTCYGAELEVLYELKDYAVLCAGSEGLVSASGWNYRELFSLFGKSGKQPADLCSCVVAQFKNQYAHTVGASVACVNMDGVSAFFSACNELWSECALQINSTTVRDSVMRLLYSANPCEVRRYTYGTGGSDVYLDIASMMKALKNYFDENKITQLYDAFNECKAALITNSWSFEDGEGGIGVYFSSLSDSSNLSVSHPAMYVKGACVDQIAFVNECEGYVPCSREGKSFLSKLFYVQFQ